MDIMNIRPIRNKTDHAAALQRMETLWSAPPGSDDAAELDALATLVDAYEAKQFAIPPGLPHEVIQYAIDEMGHSEDELAVFVGSKARARRGLAGEQSLTLEMIRGISAAWRIPADLLIGGTIEKTAVKTA
jgi:HTH-type transcriptional regulator/antitoxin HigA